MWLFFILTERGLEFGDARFQGSDYLFDFVGGEARRDVFWAVPVEAYQIDAENTFDHGTFGTTS